MVFAIDIGNSNIVAGCFDDGEILFTERISTNHTATDLEYAVNFMTILELHGIDAKKITGAVMSSVVPLLTATVKTAVYKITGQDALVVGPGVKTGLSIKIDNPAQLGSDLVVDAVAAINEYPLPVAIIDMGTATTISVVDRNKDYLGGMIMPGLKVSMESLAGGTSQLPKIGFDRPKRLIGTNTVDCMKSGFLYGNASCIDGMIDRIGEELGEMPTVVATGGLAPTVIPLCKHSITIDDSLLLKGLMLIYSKNN
ncbi:MAG: type III pantothenate kinase [Oscillospiraceae bacterium]|nr:type III pantothenate kinase [Oscillospiraceae bacterium]